MKVKKRVFDIILSLAGLLLALPLILIISLLIKVFSGGDVFFKQRRIGMGGKTFFAYKFRTMEKGSVTGFGRILRATAMDELPQLFNILKGDMSFVGPRALSETECEIIDGKVVNIRELPDFNRRCSVPPGLTGIAQIYSTKDAPLRKKIKYDLLYLKKSSLWLDIKLIFLSFIISFLGRWENGERFPPLLKRILKRR